jgi:hypothetical protein
MRLHRWCLTLFPVLALGCAGTVSGSAGPGDAEARTTSAIVVVERTVDATATARAEANARFVRFAASSTADDALRAIGAAVDLPPRETCAPEVAPRGESASDEAAPVVELVDVGTVSFEADGVQTRLVPRQLPDVTDVVSGVVYARAGDPAILPAATRYRLRVGGRADLPGFDVIAAAPADPSDVRFRGEVAGTVTVSGGALDLSWTPDGAGDTLYVDVQPAAVRCTLGDGAIEGGLAHASLPSTLFDDRGSLVVHRLHREGLHAAGLASGELRFDFARSVAYVRP